MKHAINHIKIEPDDTNERVCAVRHNIRVDKKRGLLFRPAHIVRDAILSRIGFYPYLIPSGIMKHAVNHIKIEQGVTPEKACAVRHNIRVDKKRVLLLRPAHIVRDVISHLFVVFTHI
ncbi:MAG: hypothetical protein IPN29_12345 [Saprospiraceae bacterium]|nr:hypothetical protein [Saprospiraceae bacterium]